MARFSDRSSTLLASTSGVAPAGSPYPAPCFAGGLTFVQGLSDCLETHVVSKPLEGSGDTPAGSPYPAPCFGAGLTFVQNLSDCLETHVVPKLLKDGGDTPAGNPCPAPALQGPYLCTES